MKFRSKITRFLVVLFAAVSGLAATASPASATSYGPFWIVHASGWCLEVPNTSYYYGEQLKLAECGSNTQYNQFFHLDDTPEFNYHYYIRPPYNWYCLTPGDASLLNSTIIQWGCDFSANRYKWVLQTMSWSSNPTDRSLMNVASGYCLRVDLAYIGAYVRQGVCNNNWSSTWHIVPVY